MRVLFVTIAWPIEGDRNLYSDLIEQFISEGHKVTVLAADHDIDSNSLKKDEFFKLLKVKIPQLRKAGKLKKAIALPMLNYKLKRAVNKYLKYDKFDLIISHSPPITLSGLLKNLTRRYRAPLYYLLKDIWPHSSADLGLIKRGGLVFRFFRWHEKRMYLCSSKIGCMSPKNVDFIKENNSYLSPSKIEECPNSIKPRTLLMPKRDEVRAKHNIPKDSTVFIFSGNLSKHGHGLEFFLNCINQLKEFKKAYFLIGGAGTSAEYVKQEKERLKLDNLGLYSWLPPHEFDNLLLSSDVGLILLDSRYKVPQFPSRLLAYLEAEKPVLCAVNENTDIGEIVEDANCGINLSHGDTKSFIENVKKLSLDLSLRKYLSTNSRPLLEDRYTVSETVRIITKNYPRK